MTSAKGENGAFIIGKEGYAFHATPLDDKFALGVSAPTAATGHAVVLDELELAALGDWIQRRVLK